MNIERRATIAAKPRGEIDFVAVAYNVLDAYRTVFLPGCVTRSLNARLPTICLDHDTGQIVGRARSWTDTTQGPLLTARLDNHPDVPLGRQAVAQIASGTITDVSIGFARRRSHDPTAAELKRWPGVDQLFDEVEILEVSLVYLHAVEGSKILALRSAGAERQRLAQLLARGQITPAAYRAQTSLHRDLDAELDDELGEALRAIGERRPPIDYSLLCRRDVDAELVAALDALGRRRRY